MRIQRRTLHRTLELTAVPAGMWLLFTIAFMLGTHPTAWVGTGFQVLAQFTWQHVSTDFVRDFLVFGLITALGGFFVYVPNILLLFFASALIRDAGLHTRVAALLDPVLTPFGLGGQSCLPLLFGFGCTVNALYDARGIDSRKLRLTTMLIAPFMSCGAKFGVYVVLATALFRPAVRGTVFFALYAAGIAGGLVSSLILHRFVAVDRPDSEQAESPMPGALRRPSVRKALGRALGDGWRFVRTAGSVIVAVSLLLWAASSLPAIPRERYEAVRTEAQQAGESIPGRHTVTLYNSYLARAGRAIEPVFAPLGFDWRATIAVLGGLSGRGVIISTLNAVFGMHGAPRDDDGLAGVIRRSGLFTTASAWSFMVFVLLSGGCLAAITVFFDHTRSLGLTAVFVAYPAVLAWLGAFAVYQTGRLMGAG